MDGKFIMLSGSAGLSCPAHKLLAASQFIKSFTGEVLRRGGGLVVLAGDEEATRDDHGTSHIFDWLALREIERYAESTTEAPAHTPGSSCPRKRRNPRLILPICGY